MKYIIELPEEVKEIFDNATKDDIYGSYYDYNSVIGNAIKNGTPLSKGHGRLIDADYLREDFKASKRISFAERMDISCIVDHAPTIIEADKGEKNDIKN